MANIKFTEFPSATVVGSMDIIPIVQDGANKKTTAAIFATYMGTLFVNLNGTQTLTNKTLTSPKINQVLDSNGNEILAFTPITSATDYITIKNGIGVGVPLHISATGDSANIGLHLEPKGTGLVQISDGTDTTKGIRFRSSSSATGAITLIDAVSSAGRVITLPNATGTLALTSQIPSVSGTTNYLPKFTGASALGNSNLVNDTNGQLGLGVTPSAWDANFKALQIGVATSLYNNTSVNGTFLGSNFYYNGTDNKYIATGTATAYGQINGSHNWFTVASGTAGDTVNFTQAMTLTASGNLGLGTSSPARTLHILGQAGIGTVLKLEGASGTTTYLQLAYNGATNAQSGYISYDSSANMGFFTNDSQKAVITSAGSVGIGTTTPATTLDVNGTARVSGSAYFGTFNNSNKYYFEPFSNLAGGANNAYLVSSKDDNNERSGFVFQAKNSNGVEYNAVIFEGYNSTATSTPLTIDSAGAATFIAGVALSNATAPASGIEFPSTQVASASANNLDDYEEGTWTMGIAFGGASVGVTYDTNYITGLYTKIGRQVSVTGFCVLTSKGSSTGTARITGLPFAIGGANGNYSAPTLYLENISFLNAFQGFGVNTTTTVALYETTNLGGVSALDNTDFANNSTYILNFTYFV